MRRIRQANLKWLIWASLTLAVLLLARGFYIPAKALLAQKLLANAWAETLSSNHPVKPWPWADMYPAARLCVPEHHISQIVLAGDHGNSLAFAPGLHPASDLGRTSGVILISAHRDTHFRFLQDVRPGELVTLQTRDRRTTRYRVEEVKIVNDKNGLIRSPNHGKWLVLVTCYPFNSIRANPSLRYVVIAHAIDSPHKTVIPANAV